MALVEKGVQWVLRWSMDRLRLIELIEGEAAKMSPHGRELWQKLEVLVETSPPEENTMLEQAIIAELRRLEEERGPLRQRAEREAAAGDSRRLRALEDLEAATRRMYQDRRGVPHCGA